MLASRVRMCSGKNGVFVAAGADGKLGYSNDGVTWNFVNAGFGTSYITVVAYGNGLFVAYGSGLLATSPDGKVWTQRSVTFSQSVNEIAYGNDVWIAVGNAGMWAKSTNGITWVEQTASPFSTAVRCVHYANNMWVIGGSGDLIATSPDGSTWTIRAGGFGTSHVLKLIYGNGTWLALGSSLKSATSPDGITWTQRVCELPLVTMGGQRGHYANGIFMTIYFDSVDQSDIGNTVYTSPDGINWTRRVLGFKDNAVYGIAYGNGVWVVAGAGTDGSAVATSQDGFIWSEITRPFGGAGSYIQAIAYGGE